MLTEEERLLWDISPRQPESSVETSPGINWPTMRIFYTAAVQLVYNPSVESSNQLGTILATKHLGSTATRLTNLLWLESGH